MEYGYDYEGPGAIRVTIGVIARIVVWVCILFIVVNAVAQAVHEGLIGVAIAEGVLFPLTFFFYPFFAHAGAYAWPLADGTSFIPFLITGVVAYPISTIVGGLRPIG